MQPIHHASTLVLVRPATTGFEVFLSRRTASAAFMANVHVYPGGRLDAADLDARFAAMVPDDVLDVAADFEAADGVDASLRRGLVVTALRECFEEAGVLFGRPRSVAAPADVRAAVRARLNAGACSFGEALDALDWALDASALRYFAHWVTPPFESRRFDTRFFLAPMPSDEEAAPDESELVEGAWMTPSAALASYASGGLALAPPTLCTLHDLSALSTVDEALAWAWAARPVSIEPRMVEVEGVPALLLPGDPLYPSPEPCPGPRRLYLRHGRFELG